MTGVSQVSRVLSLGCGIGDTEILLGPHVGEVVGVDLSPNGIKQARIDAARGGISNVRFVEGTHHDLDETFDAVIAIFFLHHLSDPDLADLPFRVQSMLNPAGVFYSLDPSIRRLSGAVGRLLVPGLMKRYQTADERELDARYVRALFQDLGFDVHADTYDFGSSPLAGLFPGWRLGYSVARIVDDILLKLPLCRVYGSNFEIIAKNGHEMRADNR